MARCKPAIFDLELRPNRPLAPAQLRLFLALMVVAFLLLGLPLVFLGAWPIALFMLPAMALMVWALRSSIRNSRQSEHLRLDADGLELVRIPAHGPICCTHINADWAKVQLEELGQRGNRLWLLSRGEKFRIGQFLSPRERAEIAPVIEAGLRRFRSGMTEVQHG